MLFVINCRVCRISPDLLLTALLRDIAEQFYFGNKRFNIFFGDAEEFVVAGLDVCILQQFKKPFLLFRISWKGLG